MHIRTITHCSHVIHKKGTPSITLYPHIDCADRNSLTYYCILFKWPGKTLQQYCFLVLMTFTFSHCTHPETKCKTTKRTNKTTSELYCVFQLVGKTKTKWNNRDRRRASQRRLWISLNSKYDIGKFRWRHKTYKTYSNREATTHVRVVSKS